MRLIELGHSGLTSARMLLAKAQDVNGEPSVPTFALRIEASLKLLDARLNETRKEADAQRRILEGILLRRAYSVMNFLMTLRVLVLDDAMLPAAQRGSDWAHKARGRLNDLRSMNGDYAAPMHFTYFHYGTALVLAADALLNAEPGGEPGSAGGAEPIWPDESALEQELLDVRRDKLKLGRDEAQLERDRAAYKLELSRRQLHEDDERVQMALTSLKTAQLEHDRARIHLGEARLAEGRSKLNDKALKGPSASPCPEAEAEVRPATLLGAESKLAACQRQMGRRQAEVKRDEKRLSQCEGALRQADERFHATNTASAGNLSSLPAADDRNTPDPSTRKEDESPNSRVAAEATRAEMAAILREGKQALARSRQMYTSRAAYYEAVSDLYYLDDDFSDRCLHCHHALQMMGADLARVLGQDSQS